jgi:hypothetical protein
MRMLGLNSILVHRRLDGDLMLLTTDGMDQAKTRLPHIIRQNHITDSLRGLPCHVVSTICFGGLNPLLGFVNDPSVSKNSSLVVASIHRALELQWEAQMERSLDGTVYRWPSRLHVCFDNAQGENVNSNVFRYLGALVKHGIFTRVTVGTLCVGHTHNINDQMFSVWSKYMDSHHIKSLSEMLQAFSDNYHSHVNETIEQVTKRIAEELARVAVDSVIAEENVEVEDIAMEDVQVSAKSSPSFRDRLKIRTSKTHTKRCQSVQLLNDIQDMKSKPHMEMMTRTPDVQGWIGTGIHVANPIVGLGESHVFSFDRDISGRVLLSRKFLTRSDITYESHFPHNYTLPDGKYRWQTQIYGTDDFITRDPIAMPFNVVDRSSITKLLDELYSEDKSKVFLDKSQYDEMVALCDKFDKQVIEQGKNCQTCQTLIEELGGIGVISGLHPSSTEAEKALNKKMTSARLKAQEKLKAHISHPDAAALHPSALLKGWWTDWTKNRVPLIADHYMKNGVPVDDNMRALAGTFAHPSRRTPEERRAIDRIEAQTMREYGPPRFNDMVVLRSDRAAEQAPFLIAKVLGYGSPTHQELEEDRERYASKKKPKPTKCPKLNKDKRDHNVAAWFALNAESKKKKTGKDLLPDFNELDEESVFACTHVKVEWWVNKAKKGSPKDPANQQATGKRRNAVPIPSDIPLTSASLHLSTRRAAVASRVNENDDDAEYIEEDDDVSLGDEPAQLASRSNDDVYMRDVEHAQSEAAPAAPVIAALREEDITPFKDFVYMKDHTNLNALQWVSVNEVIYWGPADDVLVQKCTIKDTTWKKLVHDLTQDERGIAALPRKANDLQPVTHLQLVLNYIRKQMQEHNHMSGREISHEDAASAEETLSRIFTA